ncbi:hypothetical protein DM02DRAFT_628480 [Periconia macrospinosa]|uniref:Uncharacterized protein n=1 Tax=Periconia macrospinosa TaxID=97972 RepID=A0A2V1DQK2_9PLEO|nr:hypothetical protein DM02DRAFT_628480 [Periconia macrospinosa]
MKSNNELERHENGNPQFTSSSTPSRPDQSSKPDAMDSNQTTMPHAKQFAIQAVEEVAKGVKTAVTGAVAWVEDKATAMSEKQEDGTGPYSSPGTCAPSDLDVIATGVLPAMPPQESRDGNMTKHDEQEGDRPYNK